MTAQILQFPRKQRGQLAEIIMWYLAALGLMFVCLGLYRVVQWILF